MKFPARWLAECVDHRMELDRLAHLLTMAGLEVEALEAVAPEFSGVVVARVLSVEKHPGADRLRLAQVDAGAGPVQIVCGAPNVAAGLRVPCAPPGARLPGMEIKVSAVRGVESRGMLCSGRELGLDDGVDGLLVLPDDAPIGADLRDYLDLDDRLFTLKLTPNRADCLSVLGVAREVAALTGAALRLPPTPALPANIGDVVPVSVEDPADCPLYLGRVVRAVDPAAPTPAWMRRRLERCGLRSISALVDITNYVLLEMGQPMHAFDLARLDGGIQVRRARPGETLVALNDQELALDREFLVIADGSGPVAVAGIMGGRDSAVGEVTRDLFLEAAFFTPTVVAGRSRRLGFGTDSSHRFERGVDFGATRAAMERATALVLEICGGSAGPVTEVRGELPGRPPVELPVARVKSLLGIDLDADAVEALLLRLGLPVARSDAATLAVTPPSYRFDLASAEDLIEEVARVHGYEHIPARHPAGRMAMVPVREDSDSPARVRERVAAEDYQEVITYAFVDEAWERDFAANAAPLRLANPIASQMAVMRSTLLGGLVAALRFNLNRRAPRVRLFELGACFSAGDEGPAQVERLAGLAWGGATSDQWGEKSRRVDFFDLKGDLERLLPRPARYEAAIHPALHPGRSARVLVEGRPVGWVGELHPRLAQDYDLGAAPVVFEVELAAISGTRIPAASEVSRFPPVRRDLAFVVDANRPAQAFLDAMEAVAPPAVSEILLFDEYRGAGLAEGKKSLAFRILLQDTQKTLTDADVESALTVLVETLENQHGAKLRE